jgi:hypothetical protein
MSADPALSDAEVTAARKRYQALRTHLKSQFPGLNEEGFKRVIAELEEAGLRETTRRLKAEPAKYGFSRGLTPAAASSLEAALKVFVESRDSLDVTIGKTPSATLHGKLMAFDGELGRVQPDGSVVMLNERSRTQDRSLEDDEHDREPEQDGS